MVELRDYQRTLLHRVEAALDADAKARVMMQLPTGGGKTEIAGQLLKKRLTDGRMAVWVTHRRELTEQTCDSLIRAGVSAGIVKSWKTNDPDAPAMLESVVILMDRTLANRTSNSYVWSKYGADDLMVVDEAHHAPAAGWERLMEQWPGQVLGMTATPWRLSKTEGFDHLFDTLICGPQIADLQSNSDLCRAVVKAPPHDQRIRGGELGWDGDYRQGSIESENSDRPEVMTARALKFWQERVGDRKKTIVYAVSVRHARNLKGLFDDEGIPAGIVLGSTQQKQAERIRKIEEFRNGSLEVLINVAVVTEGFDVPEASCIVITRPTLSLALYMQMVGRGLRAKDGGGDCLILDLADNTTRHDLPNTHREWKLEARGSQLSGVAPAVWCRSCFCESPAASHNCEHCGHPLGQVCGRCKWRPWKRWQRENMCGDAHDLVCDLCHADAHIMAHLPVSEDLIVPMDDLLPEERPPTRLPYQGDGYWWRGFFWRQKDWSPVFALDTDSRTLSKNGGYWHLLSSSLESQRFDPHSLLTPEGTEIPVYVTDPHSKNLEEPYFDVFTGEVFRGERAPIFTTSWKRILFEVTEWLSRNERLPKELIPIRLGRRRYLVHTSPMHADGKPFEDRRKLSNGLYMEAHFGRREVCKAVEMLNRVSPPHEQFYVLYEPSANYDPIRQHVGICHHPQPDLCKHPRESNLVESISPDILSRIYSPS